MGLGWGFFVTPSIKIYDTKCCPTIAWNGHSMKLSDNRAIICLTFKNLSQRRFSAAFLIVSLRNELR